MILLAIGLLLFVAAHSVPMSPALHGTLVARFGANGWKGVHTILSLVGLVLIVWGYGAARAAGVAPWSDGHPALRHLTVLLMLPVFPLLFAAYLPGRIRAAVVHPLVTAVILWSFAHLVTVGAAPAMLMFAVFLVWALADRLSLARRAPRTAPLPPFGRNDLLAVGLGVVVWAAMLLRLHLWLIGVAPLG